MFWLRVLAMRRRAHGLSDRSLTPPFALEQEQEQARREGARQKPERFYAFHKKDKHRLWKNIKFD